MKIGAFNIETIEKVSEIEKYLKPYSSLINYRQLFMSKEWIQSYCSVYKPNKMVFVYSNNTKDYILFEKQGDAMCCLGDPLNDFNLYGLWDADELEEWLNIIEQTKKSAKERVLLTCITTPLCNHSFDTISLGLMTDLITSSELQISPKLKRLQRKYDASIQYERINAQSPLFSQLLDQLLFGRKVVLIEKAPKDNAFSLDERFAKLIKMLCSQPTMQKCVFIDYGKFNGIIVSIGLFFHRNSCALYYLRWCLHSSNSVSYGLLQDLWSIRQCALDGCLIVDFSRGDEPYKYRLGLKEYKLYNYVI